MAAAGDSAPSMAEPSIGNPKRKASSSQEMSTSSGSRVRREGTMAMSSKPYALRPDFPMPISTSMPYPLLRRPKTEDTSGSGRTLAPRNHFGHSGIRSPKADQNQQLVEDPGGHAPHHLALHVEEVDRVRGGADVPSLLPVGTLGEEVGERHVERPLHLPRVGDQLRPARQHPDEGRHHEPG